MKNLLIILSLMIASTVLAQNQYGLSLDGGESFYLNDDSNNSLDLSSTWTLEAWIKVNSYNSSDFECIMDRRTVFSFYLIEDTDSPSGDYAIRFVTRDASDNLGRSLRSDTHTEKTMSLGQWHHVAVNYDGSTARLFVDETEVDSDTDSGWSLSASVKSLNIGGRYWGSYSRQLSGAIIDEVRISNSTRELSDQQTNNGNAPYTADAHTIALFNFEDAGDPPTYATGTDNSGTVGDDDITSADYVDVSESLYLENRAPEIAAIADQTIDEHTTFTVAITTSDVNHDDLTLHVLEVAGHAVISHTDTTLTVTPNTGESWDGNGEIRIIVSDDDLADTTSFTYLDLAYQDNLKALDLDGSNSFYINDDAENRLDSLTDTWFLETWIKLDDTASPGDWEVIMDRRTVFSWFIIPDAVTPTGDYALKFGVRHSDALGDTLSSVAHDQVALFFDHWYHIAVGYDGSTARMWVGPYVVDSTSTGSWELTASTNAMNIGARHWGSYERQLHGALDEIRVLTDVPDPGDLELNRNGTQYSTNSATLLLIHLDNDSPDPVYLTGTGLISSLFGNSISSPDYIDITSDLPFDNSNTNRAPFIYPVSARSGGEGELLEFTLYAYDETESVLTWEAVSNLPAGAAFEQSDNNGSFSWTPSIQQSGNYSLSFQVSDGETVSRVYFGSGGKKIENRR